MAFLLFTTQDGKLQRNQILTNYADQESESEKIFLEAKSMCQTILRKLEKFMQENSGRMEKASSHKFLTLLLNPLEESIKLCGNDDANLPENCRERVLKILQGMKNIFKQQPESVKSTNPPTSLVESYIELTLLADDEF